MKTTNLLKIVNAVNLYGGVTYSLNTGELNPDHGYSVAIPGHEERVTAFDQEVLRAYVLRHAATLAKDGNYLGVWGNAGETVLDVSVVIEDKEDAIVKGILWDQQAIWDNAGKDVIELPIGQKCGTETQKVTYAREAAKRL